MSKKDEIQKLEEEIKLQELKLKKQNLEKQVSKLKNSELSSGDNKDVIIQIFRKPEYYSKLVPLYIHLDGSEIGKLKQGKSIDIKVRIGSHKLKVFLMDPITRIKYGVSEQAFVVHNYTRDRDFIWDYFVKKSAMDLHLKTAGLAKKGNLILRHSSGSVVESIEIIGTNSIDLNQNPKSQSDFWAMRPLGCGCGVWLALLGAILFLIIFSFGSS